MTERDTDLQYEGKFLSVVKEDGWEYVTRNTANGDVCSILALTDKKEIILVEQYRIPVGCNVIESPAGLIGDIDENEDPIDSAQRELLEETGYSTCINNWEFAYKTPKSAGLVSEIEYKFIAKKCEKTGEGGGVENENIKVHVIPLDDVGDWLFEQEEKGTLVDAGIYAGIFLL